MAPEKKEPSRLREVPKRTARREKLPVRAEFTLAKHR
jgi:hypothetical protein